jgi:predicted ATP-dependent endonuclease of OLD family
MELIDQTASSPHTYKEVNSIVYNSPIGENGKGARCVSNILYHMRKSYSIHLIVGTMDAYLPILIDNIEAHLHPTSQRLLIQYIREHSERQLICSTHSPYVVSCFKPEEVIMLKLDASGNTVTMPLSEHPDLPQWKDSLDTGEFWSFVWDRW